MVVLVSVPVKSISSMSITGGCGSVYYVLSVVYAEGVVVEC